MNRWEGICALVVIIYIIPACQVNGQSNVSMSSSASTLFDSNESPASLPAVTVISSLSTTTSLTTTTRPLVTTTTSTSPTTTTTTPAPPLSSATTSSQPGQSSSLISMMFSSPANLTVLLFTTMTSSAITTRSSVPVSPPAQHFPTRHRGDMNLPVTVAIITGCLCLFSLLVLFVSISLVLRYTKVKERHENLLSKRVIGTDAAFYSGLNPQSEQRLVSSMSNQSLMTTPSDPHLVVQGPNIYFNRGFEVNQTSPMERPEGVVGISYTQNSAYQPIEITTKQSKA